MKRQLRGPQHESGIESLRCASDLAHNMAELEAALRGARNIGLILVRVVLATFRRKQDLKPSVKLDVGHEISWLGSPTIWALMHFLIGLIVTCLLLLAMLTRATRNTTSKILPGPVCEAKDQWWRPVIPETHRTPMTVDVFAHNKAKSLPKRSAVSRPGPLLADDEGGYVPDSYVHDDAEECWSFRHRHVIKMEKNARSMSAPDTKGSGTSNTSFEDKSFSYSKRMSDTASESSTAFTVSQLETEHMLSAELARNTAMVWRQRFGDTVLLHRCWRGWLEVLWNSRLAVSRARLSHRSAPPPAPPPLPPPLPPPPPTPPSMPPAPPLLASRPQKSQWRQLPLSLQIRRSREQMAKTERVPNDETVCVVSKCNLRV